VEIVDSKIGDKAEILFTAQIKRCTIGLNFFMHHHSYIGDAKVGNNVNVGAGFIVCNYDGKDKHKTIIGDDVFLGSNSVVIAPNKIERGVFIAAGSVIPANTKTGKNNLIICREKEILIKKIN
jgi:bifunctional UDP-N-acetylglucosamine pyrophosphorylase/glucosamine-1-phosphate N-acetyltransferase